MITALFILVTTYLTEKKGVPSCSQGDMIMTVNECKQACTDLSIALTKSLKDGTECYVANNGKCRQDGKRRVTKTKLVCVKEGNIYVKVYTYTCV